MVGVAQPGTVLLGKYRVERVIGVGGMGAVIAARHLQLDERVAIKFLLPNMVEHEEIVQRFLREARAAIKVRSEHCVRVLDVGTLESGAPYMVMEYLEGQDLAHIVEGGALPIADSVDWVLQAAEALAEAHVMGIVHRDLKPANLFLTRRPDGSPSVKVLDFGISKQTASGADAGVTKTQAVLGSPRYMSPEQMRSTRDVDARADVWALGAVIHELVAGAPPFDAETMTALCAAILQDAPNPLRARRPDAPPQLEAAILGALQKDRDRRYQNVAQLAAALAPFGTPAAAVSANRIARILGVPTSRQDVASATHPQGVSVPGFVRMAPDAMPPSGIAATTAGGAVTDAGVRKPAAGAFIALAAVVLGVVALGVVGVVALKHRGHDVEPLPATPAAAVPSLSPAAASSAPAVLAPATPTAVLAEPVPAAIDAGTVAAPADAPRPAVRPGSSPVRPPSGGVPVPARPAGPSPGTPKPPATPSNPFGDDRKG
jgi:serine/threonine-protein kinase